VDVHIASLSRRLERGPVSPEMIVSIIRDKSRSAEERSCGTVRRAIGDGRPYRDHIDPWIRDTETPAPRKATGEAIKANVWEGRLPGSMLRIHRPNCCDAGHSLTMILFGRRRKIALALASKKANGNRTRVIAPVNLSWLLRTVRARVASKNGRIRLLAAVIVANGNSDASRPRNDIRCLKYDLFPCPRLSLPDQGNDHGKSRLGQALAPVPRLFAEIRN